MILEIILAIIFAMLMCIPASIWWEEWGGKKVYHRVKSGYTIINKSDLKTLESDSETLKSLLDIYEKCQKDYEKSQRDGDTARRLLEAIKRESRKS